MSCTIIAPTNPNPFLHDAVVDTLQSTFAGLGFLTEVYPLATVMERDNNGTRGLVPVVYGQMTDKVNDYIEMFPDGSKKGICFFEIPSGSYPLNRGTEDGDLIDIVVRAVVTVNLHNIANRTYDFTDELIASCVNALNSSELNQDINSITIVTGKELVLSKYTYSFNELQSLAYPISGFAIEIGLSVPYNFDCVVPSTFSESYSPEC